MEITWNERRIVDRESYIRDARIKDSIWYRDDEERVRSITLLSLSSIIYSQIEWKLKIHNRHVGATKRENVIRVQNLRAPPKNRDEIKSVVKIFKEWIKRERRSPKRCPPERVDVEGKAKGRLGTALALARNVPRPREFVSRLNNQPT